MQAISLATSEAIIQGMDRKTQARDRNAQSIQKQNRAIEEQRTTSDGFKANAEG